MSEKSVYDLIKRQNGERFARAIRDYDSGIFDIPDIVDVVKYAGRDASPILEYLASLKKVDFEEVETPGDPFELLYSIGYTAEYADTLEKQNAIKPYFARNEELCTFRDPTRHKKYYIINLVHRDADKLRRADFTDPKREDEYGTSVMSIQIFKEGGRISIKNRYNHSVGNPDNTYFSNPDKIVPGLSAALKKYFNVEFSVDPAMLPEGFTRIDNRIVRYQVEHGNILYGANFYVEDTRIIDLAPHEIMLDEVVLDLRTRRCLDIDDSWAAIAMQDVLQSQFAHYPIHITKTDAGAIRIARDDKTWIDVQDGQIVAISMPHLKELPSFFMYNNQMCSFIEMPNVQKIGIEVLAYNSRLHDVTMRSVRTIGDRFMAYNGEVRNINMPNVEEIGDFFIANGYQVSRLNMPKLRRVGKGFLYENSLQTAEFPNLEVVGDFFMRDSGYLHDIQMPKIRKIGEGFLGTTKLGPDVIKDLRRRVRINARRYWIGLFGHKSQSRGDDTNKFDSLAKYIDFENLAGRS